MEAALREAEAALELYPEATDEWNRYAPTNFICDVYILAGEYDAAIDQIEALLSTPSPYTTVQLRLEPFWDPLRDHPRFQALLDKYE